MLILYIAFLKLSKALYHKMLYSLPAQNTILILMYVPIKYETSKPKSTLWTIQSVYAQIGLHICSLTGVYTVC